MMTAVVVIGAMLAVGIALPLLALLSVVLVLCMAFPPLFFVLSGFIAASIWGSLKG